MQGKPESGQPGSRWYFEARTFGLHIRDAVTRSRRPTFGWDYRTPAVFSQDCVLPACLMWNYTAAKMASRELTMETYTSYCASWLVVKTDHLKICVVFEVFMVNSTENTLFLV
jgi:hypothetical protein